MHFEQLDDDILSLILSIIEFDASDQIFEWKTTIPFLHVNQRWRAISSSIVYKNVFIETIRGKKSSKQKIITNLPLVCADYACKYIRKVNININHDAKIVSYYKSICNMFIEYKDKLWTAVSICHKSICMNERYTDDSAAANIVARLKEALLHSMPNVKNVYFHKWMSGVTINSTEAMLVCLYAHQLNKIVLGDIITLPIKWNPAQLLSLNIGLYSYNNIESKLCVPPASLVHLKLHGIPHNFLWDCFESNSGFSPQIVDFASLKRLDISFDSDSDSKYMLSEHEYALQFPILEELCISYIPTNSRLLENCVFPKSISVVKIKAYYNRLEPMLTQTKSLPKADKVIVHTILTSPEDGHGVEIGDKSKLVGSFVDKYHGIKKTVLHINRGSEYHPFHLISQIQKTSSIYFDCCNSKTSVAWVIREKTNLPFMEAFMHSYIALGKVNNQDLIDSPKLESTGIKRIFLFRD